MSQQILFDFDIRSGSNTRAAAAASIALFRASHLQRVLEFIDARGERGATDEEIAAGVRLRESTARARRVDLRDGGQVRDSGRRRKTHSGRDVIVWTATGKPLT
jgi:hypothetical protein